MSEKKVIYKPLGRCSEDGIYHGCWTVYEDGTRKFISKGRGVILLQTILFGKSQKTLTLKLKQELKKKEHL